MRPVEFIIKDGDEHLTSHSGLALIGALMERLDMICSLQGTEVGEPEREAVEYGSFLNRIANASPMTNSPASGPR